MEFDKIVCEDAMNLSKLLPEKSVNLSVVIPPYTQQELDRTEFAGFVLQVLDQITTVTKWGGVCCLVLGDNMRSDSQTMNVSGTFTMGKIEDYCEKNKTWIIADQILWVKSSQEGVNSVSEKVHDFVGISYADTPFSTIMILVKNCENIKFEDRFERIKKMQISEKKKTEVSDGVWCIQQKSEHGYKDYFPKDLIIKLIMLFSNENDLVLDPFAGDGITALAAKTLKRQYFCIDNNPKKVSKAITRLKID